MIQCCSSSPTPASLPEPSLPPSPSLPAPSRRQKWAEGGLQLCDFTISGCQVVAQIAIESSHCPKPEPVRRVGLDVGTSEGHANVALDGLVRREWSSSCVPGGGGDGCASFSAPAGASASLAFYLRVLTGETAVVVQSLTMRGGSSTVQLENPTQRVLMLAATSFTPAPTEKSTLSQSTHALVNPPVSVIRVEHSCTDVGTISEVTMVVDIRGHHPLELTWSFACE